MKLKYILILITILNLTSLLVNSTQLKLKSKLKLQEKIKTKALEKNKQKDNDLADLRFLETKLADSMKRTSKRWTKDGRLCANAFVQDGKTFTDCTATKSPDGQMTGQEWCYVDPNAGGSPNWAYCKPVLDYDKVRQKCRQLLLELLVEIRKVSALVYAQISPIARTINILESIAEKQSAVDTRINAASKKIEILFTNYQQLIEIKSEWEKIDVDLRSLEGEIQSLRDEKASGVQNPKNCIGMLGYEAETSGDGLIAQYYNNEDFVGQPVTQKDSDVDMDWDNESPASGINYENFAIKWKTYIRAPKKDKYTFYTQSDDGNLLEINKHIEVQHFMEDGSNWLDSSKTNKRKKELPSTRFDKEKNVDADRIIAQSNSLLLNGGMKYLVEFSMYHSVHNEEKENGRSFVRLMWSSNQIEKQVIKTHFMYTENKVPPIKISGINPETMRLSQLKEHQNAFKDSEAFKMEDIPFQYQGTPAILLNQEFAEANIQLSSTADIVIYIAIEAKKFSPIPTDFDDTQEFFSVLKVNKNAKRGPDNSIKAKSSYMYKVYRKKFQQGTIKIPLVLTKKNPTAHMVIFYTLDPAATSPLSCGGDEILVSDPKGEAFESCKASSKYKGVGFDCEQAFSGKMIDTRDGAWATNHQGIGSSLSLKLKSIYQISKIEIKNRRNPSERNQKIEVTFGNDKIKKEFNLKNIDDMESFMISPPIQASKLKLKILSVYGTINNGGSFNIYGVPCVDPTKTQADDDMMAEEKSQVIRLQCEDTLIGKAEFQTMNVKEGDVLNINCQETCAYSQVHVYGDLIYSADSSICKAALHSGSLKKSGGNLKMSVVRGESLYKSGYRNGVKSTSKGQTKMAMTFQSEEQKSDGDQIKTGMKVDVFDKKLNKWMPGIIQEAERIDSKLTKITVQKEGYGSEFNEIIMWPAPDSVSYCGDRIKDRDCDKDSLNPQSMDFNDIKIAFGPGPLTVSGYLADDGSEYGKHGALEFGWTRNIKQNARTRHVNHDSLLDNLILFSPHPDSKWCQEKEPVTSCEPVSWSIKLRPGKYNVKLTVGDPAYKSQYNLKVNDKSVVKKVLEQNQYFTPSEDITALDGILRISQECQQDCKYTWSRMSSVQIKRVEDADEDNNKTGEETFKEGCGLAFSGGRCNETSNVENCLFDNPLLKNIQNCGGELHMVRVAKDYRCKAQIGKLKCIRNQFPSSEECNKACPGRCFNRKCSAKPA